jgi:hypothetical protein
VTTERRTYTWGKQEFINIIDYNSGDEEKNSVTRKMNFFRAERVLKELCENKLM